MSLIEYRLKRDFSKTKEPQARNLATIGRDRAVEPQSLQRFVIQQHQASRLHYDFRLEMVDEEAKEAQVVLKSWAVPKNIPLEKGIKHLAIQTEDHPVEYLNFEGEIPAGNYGAGIVKIWDQGKWGLLIGDWKSGRLKFNLLGNKIHGRYELVRTQGYSKDKKAEDSWLIWKMEEEGFF